MQNAQCEHGHPCRCYEDRIRRELRDAYDEKRISSAEHAERRKRGRQRLKIHANAINPDAVNWRYIT